MAILGLGSGGLRMDDVYLEGVMGEETAVVGHLSVILDAGGITVLGPVPGAKRTVGWERMSSIELGPPATLPGGRPVTSLQFLLDGRPLRLLVPSSDALLMPETPGSEPTASESSAPPASEPSPVAAVAPIAPVTEAPAAEVAPIAAAPVPETFVVVETPPVPETLVVVETPPVPETPVAVEAPMAADTPVAVEAPMAADTAVAVEAPTVDAPADEEEQEPTSTVGPATLDGDDDDWQPELAGARTRPYRRPAPHKKAPLRRDQRLLRLVLVTVLVGLVLVAGGVWYFHFRSTSALPSSIPDKSLAARVGIQRGELPGWQSEATKAGNVFASGATTGAAARTSAQQASSVLARCLHVPVSALDGALGMGTAGAQRTAEVGSPAYQDPDGNGGSVSSVVDVMRSDKTESADARVFQNPALFSTCYQPFVQAMLPYAPGAGIARGTFATATVQPAIVPVPDAGPGLEVAAFQIARIGNDNGQTITAVTTAVAVFDGRVQATIGTVSNFVFPLDAQDSVVRAVEARVLGVALL